VQAKDQFGNDLTSGGDTVTLSASGSGSLTSVVDHGNGSYTATLTDTVAQLVTVTGKMNSVDIVDDATVDFMPGAATHFTVAGFPSPTTAGVSHGFTVTAKDQYNNTATGYTGTAHFTTSDPGSGVVLPANQAFAPADHGSHAFVATLVTAGMQSLTATDTASPSITGTQSGIQVTASNATNLAISGLPASTTAGVSQGFTVTLRDQFGNVATGYTGVVHFSSNDSAATLPPDATFTSGDAGTKSLSATFRTAGSRNLTATDTSNGSLTDTESIVVNPAAATSFVVSAPTSTTAGSPFSATVTVKDAFGNTATGYTGTVHLTSSDAQAVLPANSTLASGVGTFSFTLKTAGSQSIAATDTGDSSITGSASVSVNPAAATNFAVAGFPSPTTAGVPHGFTVTAKDAFGNTATGYAGTVQLTSSDAQAVLPANSTLTAGMGTFSATLKTAGSQSITATDTGNSSITGTQSGIVVNPATATSLVVAAYPSPTTAGASHTFSVTAKDPFGNVATGYAGTVHFTSSDAQATLPADYTFTGTDAGVHSFQATLATAGPQSITASDGTRTGSQTGILVQAGSATHFTVTGLVNATAGTAQTATVTAYDAFNNVATGYIGTVHLTSTDGQAALGADSMLASGVGTFGVTLKTAGSQTVTATDTTVLTITGSQTVSVTADSLSKLGVTAPSSVVAGRPFSVTVTAQDAYGNTITGYAGTVHFTSSDLDPQVVLPADYMFTGSDMGVHAFNGVMLQTAGPQSITATDTVSSSVTGSANINVTPGTVLSDVATGDADWKGKIDGVDALFTKGAVSTQMKLKSTSPGSFHWRLILQNETGLELHEKNVTIDAKNGGVVEMYLTIPALPSNVGTTVPPDASQYLNPTRSAFVTEGGNAVHVKPDDKNDPGTADLKFTLMYTTTLPSGSDCSQLPLSNAAWIAGQPADNTNVKCIYVRGLALKKHGKANIDVKLKSALLNIDGFAGNAQNTFRAGFPFRSVTTITLDSTFPIPSLAGKSYSGIQALGLVFAGKQVTAIGGFVFGTDGNGIQGSRVTLWNSPAGATCATPTPMPVASAITQSDGFYFIWNQGDNSSGPGADPNTNTLPSGMQYYVKVCDVPGINQVNWPARSIDHKLGNKEFDEEDFFVSPSTQLQFSQQPVNKKFNTAFTVKVQVQDAFNQLVTNDNATQVTLALNANPGPTAGVLSCTGGTTQIVAGGTATFNCSVGTTNAVAAKNYQLIATSNPVLKSTTSNFFEITK